jgi:putative spermidine/putrescine transport system ATP-binding protein
MSDRVAVFHDGVVVQLGSPDELYQLPRTPFVAGFIGENNLMAGTVAAVADGRARVMLAGGQAVMATVVGDLAAGADAVVAVRPEAIRLEAAGEDNCCAARVRSRIFLGDHQRLLAQIDNGLVLTVKVPAATQAGADAPVLLCWSARECLAFPAAGLADATLNEEWRN